VRWGKCLYTCLYNITKLHHLTAHWQWLHIMWPTPRMGYWGCVRIIFMGCYTDGCLYLV